MKKVCRLLATSLFLILVTGSCFADTLAVNATFTPGDYPLYPGSQYETASGTMDFDPVTGIVSNLAVAVQVFNINRVAGYYGTVMFGGPDSSLTQQTIIYLSAGSGPLFPRYTIVDYLRTAQGSAFLQFILPVPTMVGYKGGPLCTFGTCYANAGPYIDLLIREQIDVGGQLIRTDVEDSTLSGTLTLVNQPAPEPSSLMLLGTALLGGFSLRRR